MALPKTLAKLSAYVPTPVVQSIYHQPKLLTEPLGHRYFATVLFTDISGFTHLSEILSEAGPTGAEELTHLINGYFTQMIDTIESFHGQVVKFSGDALTVIFPANVSLAVSVHYAAACGLAMQGQMSNFANLETSRGTASLSMKVAIGAGQIFECSVGGALGRWEYLVAGHPLVQVAMAEHYAQPGQIILSPQAWKEARDIFNGEIIPKSQGFVRLQQTTKPLPNIDTSPIIWENLSLEERQIAEKALLCYVPGAVKVRLNEPAEWLAELRRMTILFMSISGFRYEADTALEQLQTFLQMVQERLYSFEGALNKVAVDDKGTVLLLLFGAPPFSHEDDATRAVACALDLQEAAMEQNLRVSVGIAEGQIFAGPVGGPNRREYTVLGDQVNLAARLMQYGAPYSITISERVKERAGPHFLIEDLGHITLKGKSQTLPAYTVQGVQDAQDEFVIRHLLNEDFLIGRDNELKTIHKISEKAKTGQLQILFIEGELGVGKSRLATELIRDWVISGGVGYGSKCVSYGRQVPYQAWREVLGAIHGLTASLTPDRQLDRLATGVDDLEDPPDEPNYWRKRLPLLAEVLSVDAPENNFTREISGQLRRNNTFSLIETILRRQAEKHPLLILLEDVHWADELSLSLIEHLSTTLTDTPLILILVHRPMVEKPWPKMQYLRDLPYTDTIFLEPLSLEMSRQLLTLLLNNQEFSAKTMDLLLSRTQGNPFFLQEIAQAVLDSQEENAASKNGDEKNKDDKQEFDSFNLPNTIQDVILSRIDRLPEEAAKVTLKVASVIGARFPRSLLFDIHPMKQSRYDIVAQLEKLEEEKLIHLEAPAPKWEYVFHNVVTQEVVYEGLLLAQRRQLHTEVARSLETSNSDAVEQLAFHYNHSLEIDRAIKYLKLAAQKARREYANQVTIDYYSQILNCFSRPDPVTGKPKGIVSTGYWDVLMERAKLYNLMGDRHQETEDLGTLGVLAEALNDDRRRALCARQWAYLYGTYGNYDSGIELIERSVQLAQEVGDERLVGEGYNYWGRLLYLRLEYETAQKYLQNALMIAQVQDDKNVQSECLNSLGTVAHYQTDFEVAIYFFEEAINIRRGGDNQVGLADSINNLGGVFFHMGRYVEAINQFNEALALNKTIGDRGNEAYTLHHLGQVYRNLGDYDKASHLLEKALTIHQAVGDRRGEARSLYHLGLLHNRLGHYSTALVFLEEALIILREVNDPWALGDVLAYYGWALFHTEAFTKAEDCLVEALQVERELQQQAAAIEVKAHLGRIALAQQDMMLAEAYAEEIVTYLDDHGVQGIEHPPLVYLSCYRILQYGNRQEEAQSMLQQGHKYILTQLKYIKDEALQTCYRENVPEHKDIMALIDNLDLSELSEKN
ncbi:tetratricopeptide repeat protein [Anaerolineales bacterium HSG25]|nr:tetratricopeptide repeat protein [Anaerolineales bacterium HSG25]